MSVVLIEKAELGGTCLHRGCIPTKALLHAGEVADSARESEQFGVNATFESVDAAGVRKYKEGVVSRLYKGLQGLVKGRGIQFVAGEGRLVSATAVQVGDTTYSGKHVVLATGSVPKTLPGPGDRRRSGCSSATTRSSSTGCPSSVVILGGGVIGVEFASIWKSFGAEVTIVEALPHLRAAGGRVELQAAGAGVPPPRHHREARRPVLQASSTPTAASGSPWRTARRSRPSCCSSPSAAGRSRPASATRRSGVAIDRGFVKVDEYCQTSVPTISAVGDLIATLQLAHVGFAEGILVAERLAGLPVVPIDYDGVPRVTYSEPEVASVGLTEAQAVEKRGARHRRGDLRPRRQRQEPDPADSGRGQGRRRRRTARCVGVHMVGAPGRRAHGRGPADLQLGGAAQRGRAAHPRRTRRSPRPWARRISRWPASRCTSTADPATLASPWTR